MGLPEACGEATLLPHLGRVFLDRVCEGQYILTHTGTRERVELPRDRPWALDFDEEGFAFLSKPDDSDSDIVFAEDLLHLALYESEKGEQVLVWTKGPLQGQRTRLGEFMRKFTESQATFTFAPVKKEAKLRLAILRWHRNGAKVFVGLRSLYETLGFDQFRGDSWRWVWQQKKGWESVLQAHQMEERLQNSTSRKAPVQEPMAVSAFACS